MPKYLLCVLAIFILNACSIPMQTHSTPPCQQKISKSRESKKEVASWYGKRFHHRRTSSGERFNMYKLTAAHKTLPLLSYALVTNLDNGKQVVVRVNDRGPFIRGRTIDLSYAAAKKIGMLGSGTVPVSIKPIAHT